jgi:4'-phosphopantetheinyl transferase EntD
LKDGEGVIPLASAEEDRCPGDPQARESGVLDRISLPDERAMLGDLAAPGPRWDLLLFSAKESVYKAWFPLTGRWLLARIRGR